jgi:vancomycin resistance protein YoaR
MESAGGFGVDWVHRSMSILRDAVMPGEDAEQPRRVSQLAASTRQGKGARVTASVFRLLPRLVLMGAVGLLLFAVLLFAFRAVYADRVYPAVAVGDVPVGGLTVDDAVAAVEARAAELERGTVQFSYGGQSWSPTLAELGATVDIDGSVDAAWALGRDENAVSRLGFTNALLRDDQQVPLRTTVDPEVLAGWFATVNMELDQRAVDAALVVEGTAVRIEPERIGTVVDEEAATAQVLGALEGLEPVAMELPTQVEQPAVYAADLQNAQSQLTQALAQPMIAQFEDQEWALDPATLSRFITTDAVRNGDGVNVQMAMNHNEMTEWLRQTYSGLVNRTPSDATVAWQAGEGLVALTPSVSGATLRSNAFAEQVEQSFFGDQASIEIPVVVTAPEIDSNNLAAMKINSMLGRGDSYYGGQQWDRDHNVELGAQMMSGELIAPGEEFSFNEAVGDITASAGYVDAGVIVAEQATRGVGGGICQVSTTVFRAALFTGMPITDWEPHTARLGIYENDGWAAGFDASIIQIGSDRSQWGDFRFRNDTGGYVLVQSWTSYPHVIVEIFGNDDGRTVEVGDPQLWGSGQDLEALVPRTVTYANGDVREAEFFSRYRQADS